MGREYTRRISSLGNVPSHGPYIHFDDFEHILNWTRYAGLGDYIYELDPTISFSGNQSLHLKTRTTDAAANDNLGALLSTYLLPSKKLNSSILFRPSENTKHSYTDFYYTFYDGTNLHKAQIHYYPNVPKWQYLGSDGVMHDIPDSAFSLKHGAWHRIQILADFNVDKYISLIASNRHLDLSSLSTYTTTDDSPLYLLYSVEIRTIGAEPCEAYFDDFLIYEI